MTTAYLSTAYFAPVSYYMALLAYDRIVIEQWCNYTKQTYRNRCHIAGANGMLSLSVPVVKPDTLKCPTRDIRISDHGEWRHLHWNAIASAYGSSPFFHSALYSRLMTVLGWVPNSKCLCSMMRV